MGFWVRNIIIAIILIGLAFAFYANQDFLLSLKGSFEQEAATEVAQTKEPKPKYQQGRKSTNAAAEGLSNFYAKTYGDGIDEKGPRIRNNIIFLPDPLGNLVEIL